MTTPPPEPQGRVVRQAAVAAADATPAAHSANNRTPKPIPDAGGPAQPGKGDHAGQPGGWARSLADRQAELVGALTSGAPVPVGFDPRLVEVARVALLRKRAGEVAKVWPALAAGHGREWHRAFAAWAAERPTQGSLRDGWDMARSMRGSLGPDAAEELAMRELTSIYDGRSAPRPRRLPAAKLTRAGLAVQIAGRVRLLPTRR